MLYNAGAVEHCFTKVGAEPCCRAVPMPGQVDVVSFDQRVALASTLTATPHSSGFSIGTACLGAAAVVTHAGACNWVFDGATRLAYLSASSPMQHFHPKHLNVKALVSPVQAAHATHSAQERSDIVLVSSLTRHPSIDQRAVVKSIMAEICARPPGHHPCHACSARNRERRQRAAARARVRRAVRPD